MKQWLLECQKKEKRPVPIESESLRFGCTPKPKAARLGLLGVRDGQLDQGVAITKGMIPNPNVHHRVLCQRSAVRKRITEVKCIKATQNQAPPSMRVTESGMINLVTLQHSTKASSSICVSSCVIWNFDHKPGNTGFCSCFRSKVGDHPPDWRSHRCRNMFLCLARRLHSRLTTVFSASQKLLIPSMISTLVVL